jgi:hypothetical protein
VQMERDIWILLQSISSADAAIWIADKREAIGTTTPRDANGSGGVPLRRPRHYLPRPSSSLEPGIVG